MGDMRKIDKFRGCLIGGAAGDALGYAVEFMTENNITSKYGVDGISEYELVNGKVLISDDTQMTLFTANRLLYGTTSGNPAYNPHIFPQSPGKTELFRLSDRTRARQISESNTQISECK